MTDMSWKMGKNQDIPGGSEEKHAKHVWGIRSSDRDFETEMFGYEERIVPG
jgi:hypothetical protein